MQNRRNFIKQASALIAGGTVAPQLLSSCITHVTHVHTHTHTHTHTHNVDVAASTVSDAKASKYLGLQLYSLRDMAGSEGIEKVLQVSAKLGYNSLETANYNDGKFYGKDPAELKKMVEDLGMKLTSSHINRNMSDDRNADLAWWNRAVEAHSAAGMKYMIIPSGPFRGDVSLDTVKRYCDFYNDLALITAGASMQFGYHNHDFEFTSKIDGAPVYDLLLANTSPDHVLFQLDVYWIKRGGYEPVDYMQKHPKRYKVLHIKDGTAIGAQNTVSYKAVFDQAYAIGVKDWYVEVERYDGTPEEDLKKSADYLLNANFVK